MRSRLALAVAALCVASAAQADWKNDYDRGVKAAESGNWADAESAMRAAIAGDPKPDARKRFQGVVYKVYVPHYYAGLAAYRQNDCRGAMEFWGNGASSSVVSGVAALNAVQSKGIADCRTKLAATSTAPATPPSVVATPTPTPTPPVQVASTTPPKPPVTTPVKPAEPIKSSRPTPTTGPAPAALAASVKSYLEGRFTQVAQGDPNALPDARAKAQGYLLRAASRHTLAELAGGDARQLEQARADVRAARGASATVAPDEVLFSPKFRAFWSATR